MNYKYDGYYECCKSITKIISLDLQYFMKKLSYFKIVKIYRNLSNKFNLQNNLKY